MDVHGDKSPVSSALTQPDLVTSPILWQCLCVIKTVSEFCNLSYRITKTHNDMEVLVVFREGVLGVFGPPVEPISLTLDSKGRCLLTVLFKPVERVSIVCQESGQIEVASLLAMLRLVSGKGYVFCPGFPEKFVVGKACGRLVVLHKVPFKRYQSTHCLVYYQGQVNQQGHTNSSLCALCPRCLQAAKCIYALPNFAVNASAAVRVPMQFLNATLPKSDQKDIVYSDSAMNITQKGGGSADSQLPVNGLSSQAGGYNATTNSFSSEPQKRANFSSKNHISELDVNGNSETVGSFTDPGKRCGNRSRHTNVDTKIQVLTQVLSNLMHVQCPGKPMDNGTPEMAGMRKISEKAKKSSSACLGTGRQRTRNVCHHCKKQYSSRARLVSHLQRHEALPGVWHNRFRQRKRRRKSSVLSVVHRMFRESKVSSTMSKQRPAVLSEMSVRLFLQYLDDLISSQNLAASPEKPGYSSKKISATTEKRNSRNHLQNVVYEQGESGGTFGTKCSLKRSTSDFSPMHTLLQAAAIAEVGQADNRNLFIASPLMPGKSDEGAVSGTLQAPSGCLHNLEDGVPQKKPRKSSRLASKRAKYNQARARDDDDCCSEAVNIDITAVDIDITAVDMDITAVDMDITAVSQEQCMLTNLNLLSTVSLQTAMRQATTRSQSPTVTHSQSPVVTYSQTPSATHSQTPAAAHSQTPAAAHSQTPAATHLKTSVATRSQSPSATTSPATISNTKPPNIPASRKPMNTTISAGLLQTTLGDLPASHRLPTPVNIPQNLFNSTSGGNFVISQCQETCGPSSNTGADTKTSLPSVPPLLFAGDTQQKGLLYSSLSPHRTSLTVLASTSLLRSLVTNNSKGSILSEAKSGKNLSISDSCGAIDLSKPKLYFSTGISQIKEKSTDFSSLSDLPHNMAQLVASSDSSDALHCFMLMANNSLGTTEHRERQSLHSDKQADSDLQARMFASARSYRLDSSSAPHVQAVIASSSHTAQSGKAAKPGAQTEEIQCGYKWSGSGGLVKERTQMVRELVSPDVMANYLTKPQLANKTVQALSTNMFNPSLSQASSPQLGSKTPQPLNTNMFNPSLPQLVSKTPQPLNANMFNPSLPQLGSKTPQPLNTNMFNPSHSQNSGAQVVPPSMAAWCSPDQPSSELALNLITNKLPESPSSNSSVTGRSQKSAGAVTSSTPVFDCSPSSPSSILQNILRSSLGNKSSAVESSSATLGSPQKQPKTVIRSLSRGSTPTSFSSTSTPPSHCTVSSPSLAAILRQPSAATCESSDVIDSFDFVSSPVSVTYQQTLGADTCSLLSLPRGVLIKREPPDLDSTDQAAAVTGLTVKTEQDSSSQQIEASTHAQSPISNLIMDLKPEKGDAEKLNLASAKTPHLATKNTSVRCKH